MTIIFALLGLSFLIFIHELGHYWMARKVGMKVEAFSIGFGPKLLSWKHDGVEWKIGSLPFGGYVKIAGMQPEGDEDIKEIPGGYFAHSPWDRIKVAFMGPFANILFAICAFTLLWSLGGKKQSFSHVTHKVGWVDPSSPLYENGLRPGDEVLQVNDKKIEGYQDFLTKLVSNGDKISLRGKKIDYTEGNIVPFQYNLSFPGENLLQEKSTLLTPASYLLYSKPMHDNFASKLQEGDRLFWLNGEYLFSAPQLKSLLNENALFITAERNGHFFQSKLPKAKIEEFILTHNELDELNDWKHEANIHTPLQDLYFLPYSLNTENVVLSRINFLDEVDQKKAFFVCERCPYFHPLIPGDKIVAVDGIRVNNSFDLLKLVQEKRALFIVQRDPQLRQVHSWLDADKNFDQSFQFEEVERMVASIGLPQTIDQLDNYHLMESFETPTAKDITKAVPEAKSYLQEIPTDTHMLGATLMDKEVKYNPNPFVLFSNTLHLMVDNLTGLFNGNIPAKYMAGPVGIIQVVQHSWMQGMGEAIFWLALISINLAVLNLLPIPVLDGGYILFSLYEIFTKRRLAASTMKKLIVPFMLLLVGFLLYVTYHDILRLFKGFF